MTGGSRGIGAAIVKLLAEEGAQVAFTYSSREEAAQQVAHSLVGEGHFYIKMDIASEATLSTKRWNTFLKNGPKLMAWVNNAGITKDQLLLRMKAEDFDAVINYKFTRDFLSHESFYETNDESSQRLHR